MKEKLRSYKRNLWWNANSLREMSVVIGEQMKKNVSQTTEH